MKTRAQCLNELIEELFTQDPDLHEAESQFAQALMSAETFKERVIALRENARQSAFERLDSACPREEHGESVRDMEQDEHEWAGVG
jgi:hypothetical protein